MEIEIDTNNLNTQKSEFDQINSMLNNNNNNNTSLSDSNKTIKKKGGGFESMNLIYPVYKAVKSKGFNVPTPIQRKAIPHLLQGRDVVACARTGSGKTAAFIIPMVNRLVEHSKTVGARALLILPTRELALQTVSVLKTFTKFTDLRHCLIVGGHGLEGQFEGLATNPDIIIATPGRLTQHINETGLSLSKVEYLIFDEADYLFEMGFAEQMKTILKKVSQNRQTLIFSATIPQELSQFAKAGLKEYVFCKLDQEYTLNDKMEVNFIVSKPNEKIASLIYLLKLKIPKTDNSILFCPTKYHVDYIMEIFDKFGISNVGIYGKMDQYQRKENIDEFKKSNIQVLVVTDLAARGIDLPNVGNVIQFDFPSQSKIFIHRAGRTARAGRVGKTYCLVSMSEVCYVSEILLYVGRKATNNKEELGNNSKAFCGSIPSYFLNDIQNSIQTMLKDSPDLFKTSDLATKAYQKYTKTRSSASKASIKSSHQIETQKPHPIFQDDDTANKETQNVLDALRSFKPKESALQIYKNKAVKHGHLKVEQVIGLNDAISNMKNIEKIMKQEKDRKIKAKEDQEKLQNEINQRFLKIEKSKQELEQGKIQKEMENQIAEQDLEENGKKFEEDLEGQEDDGILDDEIELNEEEYNELQQDQKQENGKTEEEQEKKVESQENKEQEEKDENENDNDDVETIKVKSDEEIMRGMTKKQKKQYIKEQAELRRQDPQKFQELQKQKQKSIKEQKEKAKQQREKEQEEKKQAKETLNQKRKGNVDNITSYIEEYERKLNQQTEQYKVEMPGAEIKKRRKQMSDFKHPTQYISGHRDINHINKFELENQITQGDVQQFIIGEDPHEILANQKRNVWDPIKKKYVMGQAPGQRDKKIQQDKEDSKHKNKDMGKKIFEKWQKKNQIRLQKDGEQEDEENMQKAHTSFKQRSLVNKGYRFTKEAPQKVKSELKSDQQILKDKKKTRQLKLKNMDKGKRTQIQNRQKQQKSELQKKRQMRDSSGPPRGRSASRGRSSSRGGRGGGRGGRGRK